MLKENLTPEECIEVLNEMAKTCYEYDNDAEEVLYIYVPIEQKDNLSKLLKEDEVEGYIGDYEDGWDDDGFDICGVWGEVCYKFDLDIWFNGKTKQFYINEEE